MDFHRPTRVLALAASLFGSMVAPALADVVDELEPGQWLELPGTQLNSVAPAPPPPGVQSAAEGVFAYSGAAWDDARERLLIWGGGHSDYAGNEVYAFDMATLSWTRTWGPTPNSDIPACDSGCESYDDNNPASRHTYDALVYVGLSASTPIDALYSLGGSRYQNGNGSSQVWRFDFGALSWHNLGEYPGSDMLGNNAVFDPVSGQVILRNNTHIVQYDPVADSWTVRYTQDGMFWAGATTAALDPERNLIVFVGGIAGVSTFDLVTGEYAVRPTRGGDSFVHGVAPGFAYDSATRKMVAWHGGSDVYSLDLDTWTWAQHSASSATVPTAPAEPGTFGRFRYAPSRNVFVLVNAADENVFVYRLSAGEGIEAKPGFSLDGGVTNVGKSGDAGTTLEEDTDLVPEQHAPGAAGCKCHVKRSSPGAAEAFLVGLALILVQRRRERSVNATPRAPQNARRT